MDASIEKRPRTRLSPQKRKLQLMEIALEVFAKRGIGRGGHADIAEIAQVSVATVFNYFPTREDLVDDVLNFVVRQYSNFLTDHIDLDLDVKTNLQTLCKEMVKLAMTDFVTGSKSGLSGVLQPVTKFGHCLFPPTELTNC